MSYYDVLVSNRALQAEAFREVTARDVESALSSNRPAPDDFLAFLSPTAGGYLEFMAEKAHAATLRIFGRTIQLYAPLYVSDFCENRCLYCGFNAQNRFERRTLTLPEVEREGEIIASSGIRHILLLTGESKRHSPVSYIRDCIERLRPRFSSISVEIYPLAESDYAELVSAGCDGLTIYQETYDEAVYETVHPAGPKRNFRFRLDAPERGCRAGMSHVHLGALLGLSPDWRRDVYLACLHAFYLRNRYPDVEIGMSVPRLRPHAGRFEPVYPVTDRDLVQIILALRLFFPRAGISISTRESARLRDNLIPLGVTRMSAGSVTRVGGYASGSDDSHPQFEISDERSVSEMITLIRGKGYDPVLKDWTPLV